MILLNPGPVNLSERVRQALLRPDLCHREPEFSDLQSGIRRKLLEVYGLSPGGWTAVLLTGSGTAAVEAMVSSLVPENGKLLVIENGVYGERISKIAEIYRMNHTRLSYLWGAAIEPAILERKLDEMPDITHVAVIHHETTTGRLNALGEIGRICKGRRVSLMVDGVSSFGAEALEFEEWGIDACAATANKCLHGVPGVSFVILRRDALSPERTARRNLYLDVASYSRMQDQGGTPFTQSVQTFYALDEALNEFRNEGGWPSRHRRYRDLSGFVREGLIRFGVKPLLPAGASSVVLNAFCLPQGVSYAELHDRLKESGFVIYAGQGDLAKTLFRVSTMGAICRGDMERFLSVTCQLLR